MIENTLEIEKIIISPEDELVDVLKEVEGTKANRIILTFAESSDLLISPINLKVIQDSADDLKKPLIALIIQNPIGVRNAKEAGMTVTESSGSIIDTFWEQSQQNMDDRIKFKKESLKRGRVIVPPVEIANEEIINSEEAYDPDLIAQDIQDRRDRGEKSEFQKKIEEVLEKSKLEMGKKSKVVEDNGVLLNLDQEIPDEATPSLLGKNFKNTPVKKEPVDNNVFTEKKMNKPKFVFPKFAWPKKAGNLILFIVLGLILVLGLVGFALYQTLPLVKVTIFVESKGVEVNKTFAGDIKTTEFNLEQGKVPVKKEEVNKSASNSTKATGTGYKGTKSEGVVTLKFWGFALNGGQSTTVKSGTAITSNTGLKFEITADTTVGEGGDIIVDAPVRALAVGEEYNLAAGQVFTIDGYTTTEGAKQMDASNSAAFEGGSKTAYTIFSKADQDKVVNELKKNLVKEAESSLKEKNDGTWELIEKSVTSVLDGDPETDVPVGAEADTVNITIKTKSTALFYQKSAIDNAIASMLTDAAKAKGLFDGATSEELKLEENLNKEITVSDIKKDTIKVTVKASSNIQPDINKETLISQLKGKSWVDGNNIIKAIKLTDKENTVEFSPTYFPDWLKHFPSAQGRLFINIQEVVKE